MEKSNEKKIITAIIAIGVALSLMGCSIAITIQKNNQNAKQELSNPFESSVDSTDINFDYQ